MEAIELLIEKYSPYAAYNEINPKDEKFYNFDGIDAFKDELIMWREI